MLDEAKLNQNFSLFNCRSIGCVMWLSIVMEKNWALSVDLYWQLALQFWVHLIDLLSILLKYNGFTRIQKAVVDQMGNRLPNSDHDFFFFFFFGTGLALGSALEFLFGPTTELVVTSCCVKSTFHCTSQSN